MTKPAHPQPTAPNMRSFSLNSPEFHQLMLELRERDEGPLGELPRDPRTWGPPVFIEPRQRRR